MKLISDEEILRVIYPNRPIALHATLSYACAQAQLESCEREAETLLKAEIEKYDKRIKELQETCTQWERLSKEVDDNEKEAELKQVKEEIESKILSGRISLAIRGKEGSLSEELGYFIIMDDWAEFWKGKGIE